jgi:hypothetical protein
MGVEVYLVLVTPQQYKASIHQIDESAQLPVRVKVESAQSNERMNDSRAAGRHPAVV